MDLKDIPTEVVYGARDVSGAGAALTAIDAGFNSVTQTSFLSSAFSLSPSTIYPISAVLGVLFLFFMTFAYGLDF